MAQPGQLLWAFRKGLCTWRCELRYSEYGVEAQMLEDGELIIGRRFDTRELAIQWAELEKEELQKGGDR